MKTRWDMLREARGLTAQAYAEDVAPSPESAGQAHGEADLVASVVPPGARVLDAGCGTGRVAVRLAELGYRVVGVDSDAEMLDVARAASEHVTWVHQDLAALDLGPGGAVEEGPFEVVLLAGNVVPLVAEGTLGDVAAHCATQLARSGVVVAGFGLDEEHLPGDVPVTSFEAWDAACTDAGLELSRRYATWDGDAWDDGASGYVVAVHARPGQDPS
ncbi:class I SAM-dependent methyltransferase [Nocardioidaceae bacterium]|nr:class I SAM-dependent methyltransferase [Nocardioidaceae bacterium]